MNEIKKIEHGYRQYVGITGFTDSEQVKNILNLDCINPAGRIMLMFGVLASYKTLTRQDPPNTKRYPKIDQIKDIFVRHTSAFNLIHYNSRKPGLADQLSQLAQLGGPNCHGFQLNICWPNLKEIEEFKNSYKTTKLVLQINNQSLEQIKYDSDKLVDKIREYNNLVDYLLLDTSGGKGRLLNHITSFNYLSVLQPANLNMGLGIAGGLDSQAFDPDEIGGARVTWLLRNFPKISIDAEGKMRNTNDSFSLWKAEAYVKKAFEFFGPQTEPLS